MTDISDLKAVILDLDGCVYIGERPVEGAADTIEKLRQMGYRILFLTNNSTLSTEGYFNKLNRMGIWVKKEEILTSGMATAKYIYEVYGPSKILAMTEEGFVEEADRMGHVVVPFERFQEADVVVAGLDRKFNYQKLRAAARAIMSGAKFIATNEDRTIPTETGLDPGAGSIVAAIKVATGVEPVVVGKPSKIIINMALEMLNVKNYETILVGDRIETDIKAAASVGMRSVLISNIEPVEYPRPDFVINSITLLPKILSRR
ncbi:MAG: HAD-IIA family hydrolase [Nitrososphaerota archaeon]|nr:HAD-IIA family hydrolase [Aigarchaeota archaeon]MDW8076554.1 HAD-IIA family hydrolase [Nitrososphaerota archaeon]